MQDTVSLLMATAILAAGGLGLYMYKSADEKQGGGSDGYNEDSLFGTSSLWSLNNEENENEDNENQENEYYEPKVRARGGKTKRSKKNVGTKRRY
jgi:hypothetical protein